MKEKIVSTEAEAMEAIAEMEAQGMKVAMTSNAGLPRGKMRITFLPASAFKDVPDKLAPGETDKKLET